MSEKINLILAHVYASKSIIQKLPIHSASSCVKSGHLDPDQVRRVSEAGPVTVTAWVECATAT